MIFWREAITSGLSEYGDSCNWARPFGDPGSYPHGMGHEKGWLLLVMGLLS